MTTEGVDPAERSGGRVSSLTVPPRPFRRFRGEGPWLGPGRLEWEVWNA